MFRETGEPLPLTCQWFNLRQQSEECPSPALTEIPGVTGACYQPSLEDVGTKICVHALPVNEENCAQRHYQGMPLFAEIGPLNLDTFLEAESRQVVTDVTNKTVNEEVQNNSEGPSAGEVVEKKGGKTFKITVVNSLSRTKVEEDEPPLVVDFVDSSI